MRYAIAIAMGLAGVLAIAIGITWAAAVFAARKLFERALASAAADIVKLQAADLIERVKNPLLRRIVNQRTGAMAGTMLVDVVREDLSNRLRLGLSIIGGGVVVIGVAFYLPWVW